MPPRYNILFIPHDKQNRYENGRDEGTHGNLPGMVLPAIYKHLMTKNVNNKKISQINEFFAKTEYIFGYQGLSPP
jgi:hypothetical protein